MNEIYLMDECSRTTSLKRVRCRNEDQELQLLLESNPDLLPGEQIDPDAPRRWLLIKREMPVTDPATGSLRWSIDFFFADQFGIPTLVECKRCDDSRSRREVVAQMLEYAANGHHYWTKSEMRSQAEATAGGSDALQATLNSITKDNNQPSEQFFETVERNLREAKMRLIFFLEESPNELRSLVDFMNRQMKDTEVLIVEARQYEQGSSRIVVPWLFGFTEEARVAKRESRAETIRVSGDRGEEAFWAAVEEGGLVDTAIAGMREVVSDWSTGPLSEYGSVWWGVGCVFLFPTILPTRGLFSLRRNGSMEMFFGYWDETKSKDVGELQIAVRNEFISAIEQITGITFTDKQRKGYPKISLDKWLPKASELSMAILGIAKKYHSQ